jgi:YidC/Oxa1 family membrane protein insertase
LNDFRPPEDSGQLQRTLIAFGLVFLVIIFIQTPWARKIFPFLQSPTSSQQQTQQNQPPQQAPATGSAQGSAPSAPQPSTKAKPGRATAPTAEKRVGSAMPPIVVENDVYHIELSNQGAQVTKWILKQYNDDKGNPLELVHPIAALKFGYPLSLWTYDESLRKKLAEATYVVSSKDVDQPPNKVERIVSFDYADEGLVVHKALTFDLRPEPAKRRVDGNLYVVKVEASVTQNGAPVEALPAWPAGFGDETVPASYAAALNIWRQQDKVERITLKNVSGGATLQQPMQWAGTSDQYFAAVFLPDDPANAAMVSLHGRIQIPKNLDKPDPSQTIEVDVLGAAVGNHNGATSTRVFVGPKSLGVLNSVRAVPVAGEKQGPDLEPLLDFGKYFGWAAKPLFIWLVWTHDHWVNFGDGWGWAIVLLTVIINVALLPLRISSMKSMMRMQKIQPQMKAIQDKYKKLPLKDPRRADMNKELGELYKREKVNPAGGCLPLLLQWPFLVAFYSMLGVAIELRHAHWLWIKDLASPDPYYLLPILVVAGMFLMQKLSPPAGGDPMQQKIMLYGMPLFIGWLSHAMACGLAVYWFWSNVVMIVQQFFMNRTAFGREVRAMALKRAAPAKPRR